MYISAYNSSIFDQMIYPVEYFRNINYLILTYKLIKINFLFRLINNFL